MAVPQTLHIHTQGGSGADEDDDEEAVGWRLCCCCFLAGAWVSMPMSVLFGGGLSPVKSIVVGIRVALPLFVKGPGGVLILCPDNLGRLAWLLLSDPQASQERTCSGLCNVQTWQAQKFGSSGIETLTEFCPASFLGPLVANP
jgi:hypothetical protein